MRIAVALTVLALSHPALADDCDDDCSAVGKRMWPSLAVGWVSEAFDPSGHTFTETHPGYANQIGRFEGNGLAPVRGDGVFLDVRFHVTAHWYAGVDLRVAWADPPGVTFVSRGGTAMAWDSAMLFTMAGVVGARLPLGRVSLRGELVGGIHGATLQAMTSAPNTIVAEADAALVEPRLAADVWLSRNCVVEAFAGSNLLAPSEHVFGIGAGFHWQASDFRR